MTLSGYFLLVLQPIAVVHTLNSYVVIYVQPPSITNISTTCWTNSTNYPLPGPRNFSKNGEISWTVRQDYQQQTYDAYWCRASMGNGILTKFSVYGDGMPRNSSEWLINSSGRRRISFENTPINDYKALWNNY